MAGIHFSFEDFKQLLALNIGISDRLDENRAERPTGRIRPALPGAW